jgi:hypothetical protein
MRHARGNIFSAGAVATEFGQRSVRDDRTEAKIREDAVVFLRDVTGFAPGTTARRPGGTPGASLSAHGVGVTARPVRRRRLRVR